VLLLLLKEQLLLLSALLMNKMHTQSKLYTVGIYHLLLASGQGTCLLATVHSPGATPPRGHPSGEATPTSGPHSKNVVRNNTVN
jgi:hypothetical protein